MRASKGPVRQQRTDGLVVPLVHAALNRLAQSLRGKRQSQQGRVEKVARFVLEPARNTAGTQRCETKR